jgi:hypothetical protein
MRPVESFHGTVKTVHLFPRNGRWKLSKNSGNFQETVETLKVFTESVKTIEIQWKVIPEEQS